MLTIKLSEAIESYQNLLKIANLKCSAKTAFRFAKLLKELEPHIANFESVRNEKIKEYGDLIDDENQKYDFSDENKAKLESEIKEMINDDINLSFDKMIIDDFNGIEIEPSVLIGLMPLIQE